MKRIKTNEKSHQKNIAVKSELKTEVKKVRTAVASGDKDSANKLIKTAATKLDIAVAKGVIHKNQAANRKSKLYSAVNKLEGSK
jgi:small subunit ribosomal protein S20